MYLESSGISHSTSPIFLLKKVLVINRVTSEILFSTSPIFVFKVVLVTNPPTSDILFSISPVFVSKAVLVTNQLTSDILFLTSYNYLSRSCLSRLLRTFFLSTMSLIFFNSIATVFNLPTSKLSSLLLKVSRPLGIFSNLSIFDLC